jgi:hypothetical protein
LKLVAAAYNPLHGEDNTIGNEKEKALNKKGKKRKNN